MSVREDGGGEAVAAISSIWMYNVDHSPKNMDHCFSCSK